MLNNMVIKSFNVSKEAYEQFSAYCKELGISMSKQIDWFMRSQVEKEPEVRKEYLAKLEAIRRGRFIDLKGPLMDRY